MIAEDPGLSELIDKALPYTFAQVAFAVRFEMARTLEDVLSRRTRSLLLDSVAALRAAPAVALLIAREFCKDQSWAHDQVRQFAALAYRNYML